VDKVTVKAALTLFAGLILLMTAGVCYVVGSVIPYIVSYFRMFLKYDVDYDTFYPLQALTEVMASIVYPIANLLVVEVFDRRSRPALLLGSIAGVSLLYTCVTVKVHPHVFIVMYSTGCGVLKGFFKQCSLIAGWSHLGGRKGLVSGIVLGGYGLGGALYGLYYHNMIDSANAEPVEDPGDGELYLPQNIGSKYPEI